jgi:hypothetical protein
MNARGPGPDKHLAKRLAEFGVIDQDMSYQSTDEVHWTGRKQTLVHAIYVATIAAAMLGWLWFIGWIALHLLF